MLYRIEIVCIYAGRGREDYTDISSLSTRYG